MASATWDDVRARRLERSSLVERAAADRLVEVVRELGGVHAQVQASAELQLATRVEGITQADVREALWERRSLVKAWTLRGTLHIHPADELSLRYAALRAAARASLHELEALPEWRDPAGRIHAALGPREARAVRAAVRDALDGRCLLREELVAEVAAHVRPGVRERLRSGFAFFFDELVQGPPQGSKITLARPDQWIAGWREMDEREALLEVCRRYLRTYGPARPNDFREWFAARPLTRPQARELFEALGDELEEIDVEGHRAYVLVGDAAFPGARPSVRLLPEYDVYVMGFREREHLVPQAVREQLAASPRGRYEGPAGVRFLLVDGVAAGLWERRKKGKRLELRIVPARTLTKAQRAELGAQVERFGAFTGLEPVVAAG
jgi:hypothetical protein